MALKLAVTLVRSPIDRPEKQKATVRGLGLRKLNQTRILEDTASIRGMIRKVPHLVRVEPADFMLEKQEFVSAVREIGRQLADACGMKATPVEASFTWDELWNEFEVLACLSVRLVEIGSIPKVPTIFATLNSIHPGLAVDRTLLQTAIFGSADQLVQVLEDSQARPGSRVWEIAVTRLAEMDGTALLNSSYIKHFTMHNKGLKMSVTPSDIISQHEAVAVIDGKHRAAQLLIDRGQYDDARQLLLTACQEFVEHKKKSELPIELYAYLSSALGCASSYIGNEFFTAQAYERALAIWKDVPVKDGQVLDEMAECHLALAVSYHHYSHSVLSDIREIYRETSTQHLQAAEALISRMGDTVDEGLYQTLFAVRQKIREQTS